MKKSIKIIIAIVIVIVSIVAFLITNNQELTIETYEINEQYVSFYFTEEGIVGDNEYYNVFSPNAGEVLSVDVAIGDIVKKGDKIGEISSTSLDFEIKTASQQINGYNAQIENVYIEDSSRKSKINSSIDDLKAQLEILNVQQSGGSVTKNEQIEMQQILIEKNKSDLEKLYEDLEKQNILYSEGIISKAEYDSFNEQIKSYETLLEQSEKQLEILNIEGSVGTSEYFESTKKSINVQISNLQRELQKDYVTPTLEYYNSLIAIANEQITMLNNAKEDLIITSPIDGVISSLSIANTNYVNPSTPVAIIKQENYLIESYISTRDIDSIEIGSSVNIVIDKRQGETSHEGTIFSIDDQAIATISALGLEERKIKVLIEPNEELNLITGFNVDIEYLLYENDNAIAIPKESIFAYEDGYAVYKVDGDKLIVTPVTKGVELRTTVVITSGLNVGDFIAYDSSDDNITTKNIK